MRRRRGARSYEGLMREEVPHGKGVLVFGNGTGGGIQRPDRGDKCGPPPLCCALHGGSWGCAAAYVADARKPACLHNGVECPLTI